MTRRIPKGKLVSAHGIGKFEVARIVTGINRGFKKRYRIQSIYGVFIGRVDVSRHMKRNSRESEIGNSGRPTGC